MARWGSCDFQQLKRLQENLKKLEQAEVDRFCHEAAKELAARLLTLAIKDTPVGNYPKSAGKKGGTLRRGWTAGKSGAKAYAASMPVTKTGRGYMVEVINPVDYASYVEFGHRTRGGKGWAPGRYMLTKSEVLLEAQIPAVLERKLQAMLKEAFDG